MLNLILKLSYKIEQGVLLLTIDMSFASWIELNIDLNIKLTPSYTEIKKNSAIKFSVGFANIKNRQIAIVLVHKSCALFTKFNINLQLLAIETSIYNYFQFDNKQK